MNEATMAKNYQLACALLSLRGVAEYTRVLKEITTSLRKTGKLQVETTHAPSFPIRGGKIVVEGPIEREQRGFHDYRLDDVWALSLHLILDEVDLINRIIPKCEFRVDLWRLCHGDEGWAWGWKYPKFEIVGENLRSIDLPFLLRLLGLTHYYDEITAKTMEVLPSVELAILQKYEAGLIKLPIVSTKVTSFSVTQLRWISSCKEFEKRSTENVWRYELQITDRLGQIYNNEKVPPLDIYADVELTVVNGKLTNHNVISFETSDPYNLS